MTSPRFLGKVIYFFGYPIFRLLIHGTTRAYVAIVADETLLLTKNWLGFQKKWRLPGGGIKKGEDIHGAIMRELHEEVGVRAGKKDLQLLTAKPVRASFGYDYYLFAYRPTTAPKIKIDNKEIVAATYISKLHLKESPLSEEAQAATRLIGWF